MLFLGFATANHIHFTLQPLVFHALHLMFMMASETLKAAFTHLSFTIMYSLLQVNVTALVVVMVFSLFKVTLLDFE